MARVTETFVMIGRYSQRAGLSTIIKTEPGK
jgi:hypothetical protein